MIRTGFKLAAILATLVFSGCAAGVGAEAPLPTGSAMPSVGTVYPTSTSKPYFGPPPVTADMLVTPTAAPPVLTPEPEPTVLVTPTWQAAPGPEPTVVSVPTAIVLRSPSPPPLSTVVAVYEAGTFEPEGNYDPVIPADWRMQIGDDELVIAQLNGLASVTLRERVRVQPSDQTLSELVIEDGPGEFAGWSDRSLSDARFIKADVYEFSYVGTKDGRAYVATVQWQLWGDLIIEVTTEMPGSVWASDTRVRNAAVLAAQSFTPLP